MIQLMCSSFDIGHTNLLNCLIELQKKKILEFQQLLTKTWAKASKVLFLKDSAYFWECILKH